MKETGRSTIEFFEDIEGIVRANTTKEVLIDTHERIGMILDLLPVGLVIHQQQGILFSNQVASELLGGEQDALVGQHVLDHLSVDENEMFGDMLSQAFADEKVIKKGRIHLRPQGGKKRVVTFTVAKLPWEGTPVVQILLQDITVQVERERQMQNMMATDGLTGAQNRRSFINYVSELSDSQSAGSCGFMLWDIDFFKNVNDTFGHQAGDAVLKAVVLEVEEVLAQRILIERPDLPRPMLSRFGGEEFAVLIPDTDLDETIAYAEKIRTCIEKLTINTRKHSISITVSVGIVMGDPVFDDVDILLGLADKALYAAKENGRNQVVCAQASMPIPPEDRRISRDQNRPQNRDGKRIH